MFECETTIKCDNCGQGYSSYGERMSDCMSRQRFEMRLKNEGWIKIRKRYNICGECLLHYGKKYLHEKFREEVAKNDNNEKRND